MAQLKNHSPGPWRACREGKCSCGFIWSTTADHPVAKVESGEWGDGYPALRVVEEPSIVGKVQVEAYMDRIAYGRVDPEVAQQNALLIAMSPEMLSLLQQGLVLTSVEEVNEWKKRVRNLILP
ncbi:MAG: hypothetical protein V3W19_10015 [Desulfatiglandales bacterium]